MSFGIAMMIGQLASSLISSVFDNGSRGKKPDINSNYSRLNNELNNQIQDIPDLGIDTSKRQEELQSELSSTFIGVNRQDTTDLYSVIEESSKKSIEATYEVKRGIDEKVTALNENIQTLNENLKASVQSQQVYGGMQSEMIGQLANPKGPLSGLISGIGNLISGLPSTVIAGITGALSLVGLAGYGIKKGFDTVNEYVTGGDTPKPNIVDPETQREFSTATEQANTEVDKAIQTIDNIRNELDKRKDIDTEFKNEFGLTPSQFRSKMELRLARGDSAASFILDDGVSQNEKEYLRDNGLTPTDDKYENILLLLATMNANFGKVRKLVEKSRIWTTMEEGEEKDQILETFKKGLENSATTKDLNKALKGAQKDFNYAEQYQQDVEEAKQTYSDYKIYESSKDILNPNFMKESGYKGLFESDEHALTELMEDLNISASKGEGYGTARFNINKNKDFIEGLVNRILDSGTVQAIQSSIGDLSKLTDGQKKILQDYGILGTDGQLKATTLADDATIEQRHDYWRTLLGYLDYANDRRTDIFNSEKGQSEIDKYLLRYLSGELGGIIDENGELVTTDNMPRLLRALDQYSNPYSTENSFTFTNQDLGDPLSYLGMEFNSQHNLDDNLATTGEITTAINRKFESIRDEVFDGQTISAQDTRDIIAYIGANLNASDADIINRLQQLIDKPDTPIVVNTGANGMETD